MHWAELLFELTAMPLVAFVVGFWAIHTYVVPNPQIRGQTIQIVQLVHFLWPPFLFFGLRRRMAREQPQPCSTRAR